MRVLRQIVGVLLFLLGTAAIAAALTPVPFINQPLVPDTAKPGGAAFTLTVNGSGFVSASVVHWNGSPRTTTFVSDAQLKADILASDIASARTASVTVINPGPGGGTSDVAFFSITVASSPLAFNRSDLNSGGGGADSVTTADLRGDGRVDIVVANDNGSNVGVLLSNGDGTFEPEVSYATDAYPDEVVVGDFNSDGKLDIAVRSNFSFTISVLLGNGDGTFQPFKTTATTACQGRLASADFNHDGNLDLACTSSSTNNVAILLGNGDGTFKIEVDYAAGSGANAIDIGDFNHDGKLDLVITYTSGVSILLGNGDGSFQAAVEYPTPNPPADSVNAADFNRDGILDLAVPTQNGAVSILVGNGDGTFKTAISYPTGSSDIDGRSTVADVNGDGNPDLVLTFRSSSDQIAVLYGNGNGTFQAPLLYPTGSQPLGVTAADFNGDGRMDLVVADVGGSTVSVLLQIPAVSISKASLAMGDQLIGTSSASQIVTLTNGALSLSVSSIAVTGTNATDFRQTNTCGSELPPLANCKITLTFSPTHMGRRTASLTITDDAGGGPQAIVLSGTGLVSGPNATLSSTSLTFATQLVGATSAAQSVTLTNYGAAALGIASIGFTGTDPGDFHQNNTCASSLASGAMCTINVTFKPTAINTRTASLLIADNAPGSPQTVSLNGNGIEVQFNPTSLNFNPINITTNEQESLLTTVTVGATPLSITGITVSGVYFRLNKSTCGSNVGAGGSCTISVYFYPRALGTFSGTLAVTDNAGVQQVSLSGVGCSARGKPKCPMHLVASPVVRSTLAAQSIATVPRPTGPSPVGTLVMDLADSTRDDPFLRDGTNRELLARFWYPAAARENCTPADYTSPRVWSYFTSLTRLPLPMVTTNSCLDATVVDGVHPVVVFTPGYTGTFTDYTFLFEDLASRGYVVVSIDHTHEATGVEFPDGRLIKSRVGSHLNNTWRTDDQTMSIALSARLNDLIFVMNELGTLNESRDNPFSGKLDLASVALAGHSLGGLTAWLGLQREPRFKAAVLLDPYLADIGSDPTETPVMLMAIGDEKPSQDECRLWSDLHGPRLWVNLRGAEHATPSDAVWLADGAIKTGTMGTQKTIDVIRRYIAAFLDTNLAGNTSEARPEGFPLNSPEVIHTTQKLHFCSQP
jgi:pimeloyl-ACP methyl ester carboxylesterase